jgi:hypothetical protein
MLWTASVIYSFVLNKAERQKAKDTTVTGMGQNQYFWPIILHLIFIKPQINTYCQNASNLRKVLLVVLYSTVVVE